MKAEIYKRHFPISMWAESDQPSAKLQSKGKASVSNTELISIILITGSESESAVDLARRILTAYNNDLTLLSRSNTEELMKIPGIGKSKANRLIASLELANRRTNSLKAEPEKFSASRDVYNYFSFLNDETYEQFWVLLLNRANRFIAKVQISDGGLSSTVSDPKRIFKTAIDLKASSIILIHNHPSGNATPSEADIYLTRKNKEAGLLLDLPVVDHVIIAGESYYSFADEGGM